MKVNEKKLKKVINAIFEFNKKRGWKPKASDLAKSVSIESAELLEHFQWDQTDDKHDHVKPKNWEEIGEEVADVFWYLISFCNEAGLNLEDVVEDKTKKLEKKYPAEKFAKGHNDRFYKAQKRKYRQNRKK